MNEIVGLLSGAIQCKNCVYYGKNYARYSAINICHSRFNRTKTGRLAERSSEMYRFCDYCKIKK